MSVEIGTTYHIVFHKRHVIRTIENGNIEDILPTWEGTAEEAIEYIQQMEAEFIPPDTCNNYDENGKCLGHKE